MGSKGVTMAMVSLWEKTLDETAADVMASVNMIRSRNRVLARFAVERQLGVDKLRTKLIEAEATVKQIKKALIDLGAESPESWQDSKDNQQRFNAMVEAKASELDDPAVTAFLASMQSAREMVRLSALPSEVRSILTDLKDTITQLQPKIQAIEAKSAKLIKQ